MSTVKTITYATAGDVARAIGRFKADTEQHDAHVVEAAAWFWNKEFKGWIRKGTGEACFPPPKRVRDKRRNALINQTLRTMKAEGYSNAMEFQQARMRAHLQTKREEAIEAQARREAEAATIVPRKTFDIAMFHASSMEEMFGVEGLRLLTEQTSYTMQHQVEETADWSNDLEICIVKEYDLLANGYERACHNLLPKVAELKAKIAAIHRRAIDISGEIDIETIEQHEDRIGSYRRQYAHFSLKKKVALKHRERAANLLPFPYPPYKTIAERAQFREQMRASVKSAKSGELSFLLAMSEREYANWLKAQRYTPKLDGVNANDGSHEGVFEAQEVHAEDE